MRWTTVGFALLCMVLAASSCTCEESIRKMVSNPSPEKRRGLEDAGESSQPSESEPNDAPEQATLVQLGNELRPVKGELSASSDVDWFALKPKPEAEWLMTVEVVPTSDGFNPAVSVEVAQGEEPISYDVEGPDGKEVIRNLDVSGDVRRIAVRTAGGKPGGYRIEFEKQLSGGAVEREPNDLRSAATVFEFPGEVQGFFGRPQDRDWFHALRGKFEPGIYRLTATPVGDFSYTYAIYTGRKATEAYVTYQVPPEERLVVPNVRIPEKLDGLWFSFRGPEKSFNRKKGYRLRAVKHPPVEQGILEGEPNDTKETAEKIAIGDVARGYLHSPSDLDRFDLAVGRSHPAETGEGQPDAGSGEPDVEETPDTEQPDVGASDTGDAGGDTGVAEPLYTPPIERVAEKEPPEHVVQIGLKPKSETDRLALAWWKGDGSGEPSGDEGNPDTLEADEPGEPVKICNHPVDEEILKLGVRGVKVDKNQLRGDFTYELAAVDIASEVEGLEIEPNDERSVADRLEFGARRTGYISTVGDKDIFAFGIPNPRKMEAMRRARKAEKRKAKKPKGAPPKQVGLEKTPDAGSNAPEAKKPKAEKEAKPPPEPVGVRIALEANRLNLAFNVLDSEGGLIAEVDRSGPGANEKTDIDLPPGLYYVVVSGNSGAECRPYRIGVERKSQ